MKNELTFNNIKNKNVEINFRGNPMANPPALVIDFLCDKEIKMVNLNYIRKSRDKRIMRTYLRSWLKICLLLNVKVENGTSKS